MACANRLLAAQRFLLPAWLQLCNIANRTETRSGGLHFLGNAGLTTGEQREVLNHQPDPDLEPNPNPGTEKLLAAHGYHRISTAVEMAQATAFLVGVRAIET